MVEFSFYRFERPLVAFCFFFLFWTYAPPPVPLLVPDEHGVLARFDDTTEVAGVARPFFFGLATAPAHVEDQARAPGPRGALFERADRRRSWMTAGWTLRGPARCPPS